MPPGQTLREHDAHEGCAVLPIAGRGNAFVNPSGQSCGGTTNRSPCPPCGGRQLTTTAPHSEQASASQQRLAHTIRYQRMGASY